MDRDELKKKSAVSVILPLTDRHSSIWLTTNLYDYRKVTFLKQIFFCPEGFNVL